MKHKHNWQFVHLKAVKHFEQDEVLFVCECGKFKLVKIEAEQNE